MKSKNKKVNISCCLCDSSEVVEITPPDGWESPSIDIEDALCPAHAPIQGWIDSQCSGCVGGWMDCDMWRTFAYSEVRITPHDLDTIKSGKCPRRTNGTLVFRNGRLDDVNLSAKAIEAGIAFEKAIKGYIDLYH